MHYTNIVTQQTTRSCRDYINLWLFCYPRWVLKRITVTAYVIVNDSLHNMQCSFSAHTPKKRKKFKKAFYFLYHFLKWTLHSLMQSLNHCHHHCHLQFWIWAVRSTKNHNQMRHILNYNTKKPCVVVNSHLHGRWKCTRSYSWQQAMCVDCSQPHSAGYYHLALSPVSK